MSKIISIHSFRGGTGKSNISSNLAYLLTLQGKKVGVIDCDIQSPGIHILFKVDPSSIKHTLNDYLWNRCSIREATLDITDTLQLPSSGGKLFIIPSSLSAPEITKVLREGYNIEHLIEGYYQICRELELDYLLIDSHPGINEETLLSISISDALLIILRPDNQDFQGTAVTVELSKKLEVPAMFLIVNKTLPSMNLDAMQAKIKEVFATPVAAILPFSEEIILLGSSGLFAQLYPNHPNTKILQQVVNSCLSLGVEKHGPLGS